MCLTSVALQLVFGCGSAGRTRCEPDSLTASGRGGAAAAFFDARRHTPEYAGPGRERPSPKHVDEVRIGWFGPAEARHPEAGLMWCAARLAVKEANESGGYNGIPFRLTPAWSQNPWGTGIKDVTGLVYEDRVWVIVGAPDSASAHLVEQVVAKARLVFVNPVSTDKTANLANVPWIFSCAPGDHRLAPILAQSLASQSASSGLAVVSCVDHGSRVFTSELLQALRRRAVFPALHVSFQPAATGFGTQFQAIREADPAAIVLIAGPADSAGFLIALRDGGLTVPVYGGPAMGRRVFLDTAGPAAEGVVFPLLWEPATVGDAAVRFATRFREQCGSEPDYSAAYTYDAVNLLIAAIRTAGLNRARIRDAMRERPPWPGVTGEIRWDPTGQNDRPVALGTIRSGRIVQQQ